MIKDKIYNSYDFANKDYKLKTKSNYWKIINRDFLKKINFPFKFQSKYKLSIRYFLDLIFKLIPRKILEKLSKIYF
tara:strand:+ start:833 stop:1060 length:228 start_codon:yes stop_codon:yes gene_type:complete